MQERELKAALRKQAKENRKSQPLRDALDLDDLRTVFACVEGRFDYVNQRDRIAFLLLYLTGFRFGSLMFVIIGHIRQFLLTKRSITLRVEKDKGGTAVMTYQYTPAFNPIVDMIKTDILKYCAKKDFRKLAFPQNKTTYDYRLNKILKKAGIIRGKTLKTHSFRIGVVTRITAAAGIHVASQFAGHRNIATTALYNRNILPVAQQKEVLTKAIQNETARVTNAKTQIPKKRKTKRTKFQKRFMAARCYRKCNLKRKATKKR